MKKTITIEEVKLSNGINYNIINNNLDIMLWCNKYELSRSKKILTLRQDNIVIGTIYLYDYKLIIKEL